MSRASHEPCCRTASSIRICTAAEGASRPPDSLPDATAHATGHVEDLRAHPPTSNTHPPISNTPPPTSNTPPPTPPITWQARKARPARHLGQPTEVEALEAEAAEEAAEAVEEAVVVASEEAVVMAIRWVGLGCGRQS